MPTPSFGPISMSDVSTETGATQNMDNFFDLANIGGLGGLNYSNLGMGPSANLTAKQAIYDQYASGQNMALSYWYSYNQDESIVWEFYLENNDVNYNIDLSFEIYDGVTFTGVGSYQVSAGGGQVQDSIGTVAPTTLNGGEYQVACSVSCSYVGGGRPPGPGTSGTVSPYDPDGVGPGTFRTSPLNIPFFDPNNPLPNLVIVEGSIGSGNVFIYSSKRTGFDIIF